MTKYKTDDMTFCIIRYCTRESCPYHYKNIIDKNREHSFMDYSNSVHCPRIKKRREA